MCSSDVSLYCAWPVTLASRDFGLSRVTCHRSAYLYVSRFSLMSSIRLSRTSLRPLVSQTILSPVLVTPYVIRMIVLAGSRYAQSSTRRFVSTSLTRLDVILVFYLYSFYACLYLYFSYLYIYWVGDGTIPIFNLLCNHPTVVT